MSKVQTARETAATLLGEALEVQAHPFMPGRPPVPPAAIVLPGSPYLSAGETFGTFTLRLEIVLVVAARVNETAANTLDDLIVDATATLVNADVSVVEVSEYWAMLSGNAEHLAVTITTSQPIRL